LHTNVVFSFIVLVSLWLLPTASSAAPPSGAISGLVRFTGAVPKSETITVSDGSTIKHSDLVVNPDTKGLRYVAAILDDAPAQARLKDAKPVLVDQLDWIFTPRVVAVQHGQAVRFDNNDSVNHGVMALSNLKENQFNTAAAPGNPITHVFQPQKRPIIIGCGLHPWMRAWVFVVEHPWFAVTDDKGKFRIENVPPGKYTLSLTQSDTGLRERRSIEVHEGKTTELTVEWQKVK
jgi:plastocyanin